MLRPFALLLAACGPATSSPPADDTDPQVPPACDPPPLQALADIPVRAELSGGDFVAVFEVDGDQLISRWASDEAVAEGALQLWQEAVMRIPTNQRAQLVQLALFDGNSDLAAYVDNSGTQNLTGRYGPSLHLNASIIEDNDPDVCAPLSGRRGTYDWTLIHEFGHIRQYADGAVNGFVERFGNETGDGEGYPDDGSPSLDGDWVTSYAERAGGDEDAAESFTTFVMVDPLPTNDSKAAEKVRWFAEQPGYLELRQALRVTEPGGGNDAVPAAPLATYDLRFDPPTWMHGAWSGPSPEGMVELTASADDLVLRHTIGDTTDVVDFARLRDGGVLATVRVLESSESAHILQVAQGDQGYSLSFFLDGQLLRVEHERWGQFSLVRAR
jgi:hypothetical protein